MAGNGDELNIDKAAFPVERYEPIRMLGKGALGEVYLAKDKTLRRVVAVKCLITVTDEQVVAFHREARIASKLSHANIIGSLDFGTTDNGRPYLALEYFDGMSLEALLEQRVHLSEEQTIEIFTSVCRALDYIHQQKIFHRDLKPSNILLKLDENHELADLRIIDFGLSSIKEEFQTKTLMQGRTLVGTPLYMSPDQVSGGVYDARSEVYSVACLMFEALTGSPPFPGESALKIFEDHLKTPPPLLQDVRPDKEYSVGIQRIIRKCLKKKKEERFQTMGELVEALEHVDSFSDDDHASDHGRSGGVGMMAVMIVGCIVFLGAGVIGVMALLSEGPFAKDTLVKMPKEPKVEPTAFPILDEKADEGFLGTPAGDGGKSVYFWGEESIERLRNLSKEGKRKTTLTLRGMPINPDIINLLGPIAPAEFYIRRCKMDSVAVCKRIGQLQSVGRLGIWECELSPEALGELKTMPHLHSIILENCNLDDTHMAALATLTRVQQFSLEGNKNITLNGVRRMASKNRKIAVWLNEGQVAEMTREEVEKFREETNILLVTKTADNPIDRDIDKMMLPDSK